MKVCGAKTIEECLDGVVIKELTVDAPLDPAFITQLGNAGKLEYFRTFTRPFFRLTARDFLMKGVEGNQHFQVVFNRHTVEIEQALCVRIADPALWATPLVESPVTECNS